MDKNRIAELAQTDKRILTREILRGDLLEKDLRTFVKVLSDVAENVREVTIPMESRKRGGRTGVSKHDD
ncbi:MAG: hypothetical protein LLG93_16320 [Deltaproteobacteria bacterium]|nr:hypothetical protein [Deltaproteobacteria bacterium]